MYLCLKSTSKVKFKEYTNTRCGIPDGPGQVIYIFYWLSDSGRARTHQHDKAR